MNDKVFTDVFAKTPLQTNSVFSTNEIQLVNGTFYRFIVVYRERRLVGSSGWLVFQSLKYDYRERVEVYKVYLESETEYYHKDNDRNCEQQRDHLQKSLADVCQKHAPTS